MDKEKLSFDFTIDAPGSHTTHEKVRELHDLLVQTCIDFINKYDLRDIEAISFLADGLNISSKYGEWTPSTDSSIHVYGEDATGKRVLIDENL